VVVMTEAETIDVSDLPADVLGRGAAGAGAPAWPEPFTLDQAVESTERAILLEARRRHGSQALIAQALGVNQSTVARKMKKYGIA
jgi:transcriptional regulator with PAS, ATPase and Fis domain